MPILPRLLAASCLAACVVAGSSVAGDPPSGQTTLYKWVDADGTTHYSDRPAPGAEEMRVSGAQTYRSPGLSAQPTKPADATKPAFAGYQHVDVTKPQAGESFANPGGHVDAAASVDPGLQPGHQLWFVLDGTRLSEPSPSYTASLDVHRGTHTVAVVILDSQGHEVIGSTPVTFYVREASIATPPTGPLVHPKPR